VTFSDPTYTISPTVSIEIGSYTIEALACDGGSECSTFSFDISVA
jgi:hypothetical protein